eukprot:Gb_38297 [translate_table: standard]
MGFITSTNHRPAQKKPKGKDKQVTVKDLNRACREGRIKEAVEILHLLGKQGIRPDYNTYVRLLHRCIRVKALVEGKQIHFHMMKTGLKPDIFLRNNLVSMYVKCGNLEDSRHVFDKMPERNTVSWTALIAGYTQKGRVEDALEIFCRMYREGLKPNQFTFATILGPCASLGALKQGKQVHAHIIKAGFETDIFVASSLVVMYSKCKTVDGAQKVFNEMSMRDVVSWNAMIAGYAQNGYGDQALKLFCQMVGEGIKPNHFTIASALTACAGIVALEQGKCVHALIMEIGFVSDIFVGGALIDMYAKCGSVEDAHKVFNEMPKRDVVSWNAMITGYAQNGPGEEAVKLFCQMQQAGTKPSQFTFASVLKTCASLATLEQGQHVHAQVIKFGYVSAVFVVNALVDMYAKCESMDDARGVFDKMTKRNVVSCNAMIAGYAQHGLGADALKIFCQMLGVPMKPDLVTYISVLSACTILATPDQGNQVHAHILKSGFYSDELAGIALIDMYAKFGSMDDARKVFDNITEINAILYTALIAGYMQNGYDAESLQFFCRMHTAGRKPNQFTFLSVLRACGSIAAIGPGNQVYACIVKIGFESDVFVGTALVDMYSKCGRIEDACKIFEEKPKRCTALWNAMITAYAQHGLGKRALKLFEQMQWAGMKPTYITFIGVLFACSNVGLVDKGRHYFDVMSQDYCIIPTIEHYTCMVDLLGRAGHLYEAENFISKMPFEPGAVVWRTLLVACRVHGNMELGKHAAKCCIELQPHESATYVLLSDIYAAAGKWIDVENVINIIKSQGLAKEPGRSWIEVKNRVHEFITEDRSHPQTEEIYTRLEILIGQMKIMGYMPDTDFFLHDVECEQKKHCVGHHSEKLAIAFGLISTPIETPIRVVKNLRVCRDCHTAAKFMSLIVHREIVVRDVNCFHHFKDGRCSCGDYCYGVRLYIIFCLALQPCVTVMTSNKENLVHNVRSMSGKAPGTRLTGLMTVQRRSIVGSFLLMFAIGNNSQEANWLDPPEKLKET